MHESAADFLGGDLGIRAGNYEGRFALRGLKQFGVADEVGYTEAREPRLARTKKFARASQFQVGVAYLEAVVGFHHGVESSLRVFADFSAGHQDAIRLGAAAADASAQLV